MVVIPIYNLLLVPDANVYLKSDQYRHLARRYAQVNDRVVLLSCKKEEHRKDMTEESFFPIGVTGYVNEVNPEGYVEIRTTGRVHLDTIGINPDHTIELTISRCEEIEDLDEGVEKAHFERLKEDLKESWQGFEWGEQAMGYLNQFHSINEVAVAMSIWFKMSAEEKYDILAQDSHKKRFELLEKAVYEFMEVSKVTTKAASAQQEDYQKIYRENAIKKQMELLQRELDEMHPEKVSDIRKFELKIEEAGMNETAKGEALKVLNRLKQENNGGTEAGMLYDYLDFVTGLSWKTEPQQDIDLSEAEAVLEEDHFGLGKVKSQAAHHPADRRHESQEGAGGLDSALRRRTGHRQDKHRAKYRQSPSQRIRAREPGRRARRGGYPRSSQNLHRRYAGQNHGRHQEERRLQSGHGSGRGGQAGRLL